MAEEKPEGTPPEGTPPEGTPPEGTPSEGTPPKETETNWEQRYKDLQVDHTRASQRATDAEARIEQLEQAGSEESDEDLGADDEGFVDRKTVDKIVKAEVSKALGQARSQSANAYFRRTYPELVDDQDAISGILRSEKYHNEMMKCASGEERIDFAVKKFQERLDKASADAKTEAEAEAKAKEEARRKASGLGATATSTPAKGDEDVSDEQELKNRKVQSARKRNLV